MTDVVVTFNSLYNLLREERLNKPLQELPSGFYESVKSYLNDKRNELKNLKSSKSEKYTKEKRLYDNSVKIINEIIEARFIKITSGAIKNTLRGEVIVSEELIVLDEEKDFYKKTSDLIKGVQKKI